MKFVFKTPDLGEGTTQAEIVEWRVGVGDVVREDQPIADLMTDKATVEVSSPVDGRIVALNGAPGEMMAVGSELVVFDVAGAGAAVDAASGEAAARPRAPAPTPAPRERSPGSRRDSDGDVEVAPPLQPLDDERAPSEKAWASPAARRRAVELGVELAAVAGSGPNGRILREDIEAFAAARPATRERAERASLDGGVEEIRIVGVRRRIAERMQDAKRRIPHIAYVEELDVTALEDLRAHLNAQSDAARAKFTLLPFLMRAIVKAARKFPQINAHFDDEAAIVRRYRAVHIGVATQTSAGLVVPVVRNVEGMDLWRCARELVRLSDAARTGKAAPDELKGSTITLSSLGALGGIASTPIINAPEVAIVGVNRIVERPVVWRSQIVTRKMMNLSSSFDHRVVDGWDAASFIQAIKVLIEQPALLFMDEP